MMPRCRRCHQRAALFSGVAGLREARCVTSTATELTQAYNTTKGMMKNICSSQISLSAADFSFIIRRSDFWGFVLLAPIAITGKLRHKMTAKFDILFGMQDNEEFTVRKLSPASLFTL